MMVVDLRGNGERVTTCCRSGRHIHESNGMTVFWGTMPPGSSRRSSSGPFLYRSWEVVHEEIAGSREKADRHDQGQNFP